MSTQRETTRTATTAFGDVEFETVECASCGNECAKADAQRFVMGNVRNRKDWRTLGHVSYDISTRGLREGWVCEYCQTDGPIAFPESSIRERLSYIDFGAVLFWATMGAIILILTVVAVLSILGVIA